MLGSVHFGHVAFEVTVAHTTGPFKWTNAYKDSEERWK